MGRSPKYGTDFTRDNLFGTCAACLPLFAGRVVMPATNYYVMFPAPRGLQVRTRTDISKFLNDGRIPGYIQCDKIPDVVPTGYWIYWIDENGMAKLCREQVGATR